MQVSSRMLPLASLASVLALAAGCGDSSTGPEGTGRVTFQLATKSSSASAIGAETSIAALQVGEDVLVITDVQLVARKIKLQQVEGSCPPADLSDEGMADTEDEPDCPIVWLAPRLLLAPVTAGAQAVFTVDLPEGTFDQLKLQLHKPSDANADAEFLLANPDFLGVSIKVTGTFNGEPFTFTSALTSVVELELEAPVVVAAETPTAVTLMVDVESWFLASGGASLINPIDLDQQFRSQVEQNIRGSFRAFEDEDQDGNPG